MTFSKARCVLSTSEHFAYSATPIWDTVTVHQDRLHQSLAAFFFTSCLNALNIQIARLKLRLERECPLMGLLNKNLVKCLL